MPYKLVIRKEVFDDIQNAMDWYNSRQKGLGKKFFDAVQQEYKTLRKNPVFQVRYENVHCLPMKKFPYMIHFIVEEDARKVVVLGVINTNLDSEKWKDRI